MVPVDETEEAEDESSSGISGSSGMSPVSPSSSASLKSAMALSFALAHLRWRSLILSGESNELIKLEAPVHRS